MGKLIDLEAERARRRSSLFVRCARQSSAFARYVRTGPAPFVNALLACDFVEHEVGGGVNDVLRLLELEPDRVRRGVVLQLRAAQRADRELAFRSTSSRVSTIL